MRVHLLITNNESTIKRTLESLLPLECEIVVGNIGSRDKTAHICQEYGAKVIHTSRTANLAKIRNSLLGEDWNFYLHPWEILAGGHEIIRAVDEGSAYHIPIYKNNIVTYEIRLCRECRFKNPIYETVDSQSEEVIAESAIYATLAPYYFENTLAKTKKWSGQSISLEASYYQAFALLEERNIKEFATLSEHYLSLDSHSISATMLRYYLAQAQLYAIGDISKAVRNTLTCIITKPLMAEFWCLLGDIYYKQKRYKKAKSFYETAIFLGRRRLNHDLWPIELDKYENHPKKMISNIQRISDVRMFGPTT